MKRWTEWVLVALLMASFYGGMRLVSVESATKQNKADIETDVRELKTAIKELTEEVVKLRIAIGG